MTARVLILWIGVLVGAAAQAATHPVSAKQWEQQGVSLFFACEFKQAAHAFEMALVEQPDQAALHYWLGKSYARQADVSSPITAPKWARKAARSLEKAVRMEPRNPEYLHELFEFYVDSPEWFGGGLARARALLEEPGVPADFAETAQREIAASRSEHSGFPWWTRDAILRTSGLAGSLVPVR